MNGGIAGRSVIMIAARMAAHATASGYDRLQEFVAADVIHPPQRWSVPQRAVVRSLKVLVDRSGSRWYHRQNLWSELAAARRWLAGSGQIFHFLYGENSYRYLGQLKRLNRGHSIVCTYHTPDRRFAEVVTNHKHLSRIDAAIAVSTVQLDFLSEHIGSDRVYFVPHGIDVEYFKPGARATGDAEILECLFVGSHLRDVDTLASVARRLESIARVRFTLVTRPENATKVAGLRNVEVKLKVGDAELLDLYRRSHLLVFPLLDCTANNSLLEAMACGLPILSTDLPGVRDYILPECAVLVSKGATDPMCDALLALEADRGKLKDMGAASRRRALELRWEAVAQMTRDVYERISP